MSYSSNMMSAFKMSAKHCSFIVFPMKVIFHCLLREVNICNLKWDPESNILCGVWRRYCNHRTQPGPCWPADVFLVFARPSLLLRCHFWSVLIAFICFVCAVTSITAFILWDLSAGWLWFAGFGASQPALSPAAGRLSKHRKHKHKHNGESTPLSSSSVHIELWSIFVPVT